MILAAAYVPLFAIPYLHAIGVGGYGPVDFMSFWSAGKLAWANPASAYDAHAQIAFQVGAFHSQGRYLPFLYPPPFLAVTTGLALLPFAVAYPLWAAATWGLYIAAARRLAPAALWPIAVAPALFVNAVQGQTAALFAALFIFAARLLDRRPVLAGLLFGALVFKPQLGLLIPVALAAGGQWRAFAGAAASALGLMAGALVLFGPETFQAFLAGAAANGQLLQAGALPWGKIQSLYGALRQVGAPNALAAVAQGLAALAAAVAVGWTWRSTAPTPAKAAVLAAGALVATPYLLDYDFVLLIVPLAWLAARGMAKGFAPWERIALLALYAMPLACRALALWAGFNLAPLAAAALLGLVVARLRGDMRLSPGTGPWPRSRSPSVRA